MKYDVYSVKTNKLRVTCPVCFKNFNLRKDLTLPRHKRSSTIFVSTGGRFLEPAKKISTCPGSNKKPVEAIA